MTSNNKIAIVTGASTGLGQSISLKLALKGYNVVLASRNEASRVLSLRTEPKCEHCTNKNYSRSLVQQ